MQEILLLLQKIYPNRKYLVLMCEGIFLVSSLLSGTMNCLFRLSWIWHINLSLKCHQCACLRVFPRLFGISEMRQHKVTIRHDFFFHFKRWIFRAKYWMSLWELNSMEYGKWNKRLFFFQIDILINSPEKLTVCIVDGAQWGRNFETYFTESNSQFNQLPFFRGLQWFFVALHQFFSLFLFGVFFSNGFRCPCVILNCRVFALLALPILMEQKQTAFAFAYHDYTLKFKLQTTQHVFRLESFNLMWQKNGTGAPSTVPTLETKNECRSFERCTQHQSNIIKLEWNGN